MSATTAKDILLLEGQIRVAIAKTDKITKGESTIVFVSIGEQSTISILAKSPEDGERLARKIAEAAIEHADLTE